MQIIELIPVNQELKAHIEKKAQEVRMFGSIEQFITMFNAEILKATNPVVKEMAEEIQRCYKNVSLVGSKLIIETPAELACEASIKLLQDWQIIIKLKRLAMNLLDENYPINGKIVFTPDKNGFPQIETLTEDGNVDLVKHWTGYKIVSDNSAFANNLFTRRIVETYTEDGLSCYFNVAELIDIDDSFILEIEKAIYKNTFLSDQDN